MGKPATPDSLEIESLLPPAKRLIYTKPPPMERTLTVNLFLDARGETPLGWGAVLGLRALLAEDYPDTTDDPFGAWFPTRIRLRPCGVVSRRDKVGAQYTALEQREATPLFFVPKDSARHFTGILDTWVYWYAPDGKTGRLSDLAKKPKKTTKGKTK